jgi:acyl-CoA thioester hydrolase
MSEFAMPLRVYYEDTDVSGVVYHANYLKFFERARTEWLRQFGISQEVLRERHGIAFTVANMQIDFLAPARLDDALQVTVDLHKRKRASLEFRQNIRIAVEPQRVLAQALVRVGCVDMRQFRPRALPELGF